MFILGRGRFIWLEKVSLVSYSHVDDLLQQCTGGRIKWKGFSLLNLLEIIINFIIFDPQLLQEGTIVDRIGIFQGVKEAG